MRKEILFQLDIAWQLFEYHCQNLNDEEALWCINEKGLQIRKNGTTWVPDWPDTEAYDIGPSSISWIMWHILFWWKSTISASKDNIVLNKDNVKWPGNTNLAIIEIRKCHFVSTRIKPPRQKSRRLFMIYSSMLAWTSF